MGGAFGPRPSLRFAVPMPPLSPLPIDPLIPQVQEALAGCGAAVVVAPPGAGKTTRIPPALLLDQLSKNRRDASRILLLQPRRVAARAVADRIAREQGWQIGREVGWQIRFENRTGPHTLLHVLTEGILTRRLQSDPFLEGVGCVILDEFHERSIHTDLALALLCEIRRGVRPDLRLLVMSATLDPDPVARFLGEPGAPAPVIRSPGRVHPVALEWIPRPSRDPSWQQAAAAARALLGGRSPSPADELGHLLIFLPGFGEIRRAQSLLAGLPADIHLLHGGASADAQDAALRPSPRRKLVLATNIAETSLTIDGVRTVIDSGLARIPLHDPRLGIDRLELRRISRASADQRAGRAGRTAPGRCLRLWTREEESALAPFQLPEIHRLDLAPTLLALLAFGESDPARFRWFEAPRPEAVERARSLLAWLGAIDPAGRLTAAGRNLANLPLHPRLGRMLLAGAEGGRPREAATLAALLSERDLLEPARGRRAAGWEGDSDLLDRLEWIEDPASRPDLDPAALRHALRIRSELTRLARPLTRPSPRPIPLLQLPLFGWPDRVALRRASDPSRAVMVGGRGIVLDPASSVRRAPCFLALDPREQELASGFANPSEARVSLASAIDPAWLESLFPDRCERRIVHAFDTASGKVVSLRRLLYADLVLREDPAGPRADPDGASRALAGAVARDPALILSRDPELGRWLARVAFLRRGMPELNLPAFEGETLAGALADAAAGATTLDQLCARNLRAFLSRTLDGRQRAALDREAPDHLAVPSGSRIRIDYADPAGPVLAVRMQELFGLPATPRLAAGRVPVVLHLLAPNHRPVQVTADLASFWNGAYQEVRRDLRARYPRHPWPDDPWNAAPAAVGRRRPTR